MLPIILNPENLFVLVIGEGPATQRRLEMLKAANVKNIKHFPSIPDESEFNGCNLIYSSDMDDDISGKIYRIAQRKKILINTEDRSSFCDFHAPAIIRRGDLLLTVSTAGKGPRLSRRIKALLQNMFGPEWKDNLEHLAAVRAEYKKQGYKFDTMAKKIDEEIDTKNMFKDICDRCNK